MTTLTAFRNHQKGIAGLFLIVATLIVYAPVKDYQFVDLDDDLYVAHNPRIQNGLTWGNIVWALRTLEAGFWHPLTWWSHMLDCELFGLNPGGHHLTNLLLHTLNVFLLFWLLQQATGAVWRSFLVGALFALHPLNVESVAWVAERKNVLSTLFWLLTIWAYLRYVKKPGWKRYLQVVSLFVLGLMAKPMLVTLPCVLLLLDYWPLGRLGSSWSEFRQKYSTLLLEKVPLLSLAVANGLLAIQAQQGMGALPSLQQFSFGARLANAVTANMSYLSKMIWPTDLVVFYPHPETSLSVGHIVLAILVVSTISLLVWLGTPSFPYLSVGWLWYLGTLLPVSGLIQVGQHAMADRYMYVPLMGLFILVVWGFTQWLDRWQVRKELWIGASVCLLIGLSLSTRSQLAHWQNSITLFEHTIRSTDNNDLIHNNLGTALLERGEIKRAIEHFSAALEIKPDSPKVLYNMGLALKTEGRLEAAVRYFSKALEINPKLAGAHNNLGIMLLAQGHLEEAIQRFSKALENDPQMVPAHNNLGTALVGTGRVDEALWHFSKAVAISPDQPRAYNNLGAALDLLGRTEEAIYNYRRSLELAPGSYLTLNNLGKIFMDNGNLDEAARHFSRATELEPNFSAAYFNLGLVRTDQGRMEEAIHFFRQVLKLNPDNTDAQNRLLLLLQKVNP